MGNIPPGRGGVHHVKPGETLAGIAYRYGLNWHQLAELNHVGDPRRLQVGAKLRLPGGAGAPGHARAVPHPPLPTARALPAPASTGSSNRPGTGRLGDLSMFYETTFRPGQEAAAAAVVSSGKHDAGGVSYGAYQLASSVKGGRQVQAFLRTDGRGWAARFGTENPGIAGGAFGTVWKAIAAEDPQTFFSVQHGYIARTHYNPVVAYVRTATGLDVTTRHRAVQNAVWSMSVQHGKASKLVAKAVQAIGQPAAGDPTVYDRALVNSLYDVREAYVDSIGLGNLKKRYRDERRDALRMLDG